MIIAGRDKWKVLLRYYPPWDGRPLKRRKKRKAEVTEVLGMLGDPRKLKDLPEDVRALLRSLYSEALLQEA
ncbi:hypothetical protein [Thermococcus celer]|uniref:Uncharacterized protein n=1 Tax=Thermococcus celer Vu 13 = JCM 8558 TaxID=1293037 RepID=A0A218P1F7_THECE|nr:hypothetical protein [Thermococcus celer]ASI98760.1 hypothetical protein A3L02_03880 [Thermococcus celer Vu 13 = JCM 8558]